MSIKLQPWLRHSLFVALLVGITLILFRGALSQGMEMDEVSRVIQVIPLLNRNAEPLPTPLMSVEVLNRQVPIMFKQYISSAYLLRYLPLAFFSDFLVGIRFLHWFYFVISLSVFYLVMSKFSHYIASFGALLIATSPLYYPEVRINFADSLQILYLSLAAIFFVRFLRRGERKLDLFFGFLLLFFAANQMFYFSWVIAGLVVAGAILFPQETLRCFYPFSRSLVVALALLIGLANFVAYNLDRGFPTLMVLVNRLFRPEVYNESPIDYRTAGPFFEEVAHKLSLFPAFFDIPTLYVSLYLGVFCSAVLFLIFLRRHGSFSSNRLYFFPGLTALVVFLLILATPNTTRVGHFIYLVPFLQLSFLASVLGLGRMLTDRLPMRKILTVGLPLLLVTVNFAVSNKVIAARNRTGGTMLFSPAIFNFVDYLKEHSIDSGDVLFTEWGLHLQSYFLCRGEFWMRRVVYELIQRPRATEKLQFFEDLFASYEAIPAKGDSLYLPLFARHSVQTGKLLLEFLRDRGGHVVLEHTFPERDGQPAILLYRLDAAHEFISYQCAPAGAVREVESFQIQRFGPQNTKAGAREGLPMWFIASELTAGTRVMLNGIPLRTVFGGDHLTALVPRQALGKPCSLSLCLFDPLRHVRSPAVRLKVE